MFAAYQRQRILELQQEFMRQSGDLYRQLQDQLRRMQTNRFLTARNRQILHGNLINQYNRLLYHLRQQYTAQVQSVQQWTSSPTSFAPTPPNGQRRALVVGLNYEGTDFALEGCVRDSEAVQAYLSSLGYQVTLRQSITRDALLREFEALLRACRPGDTCFFYFSGHGSYLRDRSGDEADGQDECLVTSDAQVVTDDQLRTIIQSSLAANARLVSVIDTCHSGTMLDLAWGYNASQQVTHHPQRGTNTSGHVLSISGCQDQQTSVELPIDGQVCGALTHAWLTAAKTPNQTWGKLLQHIQTQLSALECTQQSVLSTNTLFDLDTLYIL